MNNDQREIEMMYIKDEMIYEIIQVAAKHLEEQDLWNFWKYSKHNGVEEKLLDLINKFY